MAAEQLAEVVDQILAGARVCTVGRSMDMGVIEFVNPCGEVVLVHIQCPFRIIHDGIVVLGSRDSRYPQRGYGEEAFDNFKTIFDSRAEKVNGYLARERPSVTSVAVGAAGEMTVEWASGTRLEAFPDCSGPVEAWRVFIRDGRHWVFPPSAA